MTTTSSTTARAVDYDEIVRVVQLYIDGFRTGNTALFEEAFHNDAWIFFTEADGTLVKAPTRDCYQEWASSPNPNIKGRIVTVTQAGEIANVLLGWDDPAEGADSWVDLQNLIRLDGVWKITNMTATHTSRAGGV
jgi:hypothetical protein